MMTTTGTSFSRAFLAALVVAQPQFVSIVETSNYLLFVAVAAWEARCQKLDEIAYLTSGTASASSTRSLRMKSITRQTKRHLMVPAAHGGPGFASGPVGSDAAGERKAADGGGINSETEAAQGLPGGAGRGRGSHDRTGEYLPVRNETIRPLPVTASCAVRRSF